jgi:regulator of protease activity HflC (stomatin/prohibitin superfamily)
MDVLVPAAIAVIYCFLSLRVLRQYERGVAFFLGRFWGTKGPGSSFSPPDSPARSGSRSASWPWTFRLKT